MLERLNQLEINITELEKFKAEHTIKDVRNDLSNQWILRYGLLESIQIVIDISCHLSAKYNLGNPQTYAECIEFLIKEKFYSIYIGKKLTAMIGLRNLLIHEYVNIDQSKLFDLLNNLGDFKEFADEVKDLI